MVKQHHQAINHSLAKPKASQQLNQPPKYQQSQNQSKSCQTKPIGTSGNQTNNKLKTTKTTTTLNQHAN